MLTHLGNFPARLAENGHAVYEYTPCPPVGYPELDAELWCHRYYLRNLCDTERFLDWPIVDHVPFLQVGQGACDGDCSESWHDLQLVATCRLPMTLLLPLQCNGCALKATALCSGPAT